MRNISFMPSRSYESGCGNSVAGFTLYSLFIWRKICYENKLYSFQHHLFAVAFIVTEDRAYFWRSQLFTNFTQNIFRQLVLASGLVSYIWYVRFFSTVIWSMEISAPFWTFSNFFRVQTKVKNPTSFVSLKMKTCHHPRRDPKFFNWIR